MSTLFTSRVRVRGYECDSLDHVNNEVYLQYLQQAKLEARRITDLAEAGLDIRKLTISPYAAKRTGSS